MFSFQPFPYVIIEITTQKIAATIVSEGSWPEAQGTSGQTPQPALEMAGAYRSSHSWGLGFRV